MCHPLSPLPSSTKFTIKKDIKRPESCFNVKKCILAMRRFRERFLLHPCQRLPSLSTKSTIYNHRHCHPVCLEEGDQGGGRGPSDVVKLPLNLTPSQQRICLFVFAFVFCFCMNQNIFTFMKENVCTFFWPVLL